ncbi:MAG: T9SS type A sorting domain-containing protein, partial [Flavobacteriales bacterium]|nr:T9SS type A sorting domain-containing protein [Flavobacteriales bacterium]
LERRSGNQIVDFRQRRGQPKIELPVTIDLQDVTFWEALDHILDEAGMIIEETEGQQRVISRECHRNGNERLEYAYEYEMMQEEMEREMDRVNGENVVLMRRIHEDENTEVIHKEDVYKDVEDVANLMRELGIEYDGKGGTAKKVTVKQIVIIEEEESENVQSQPRKMVKIDEHEMNFYPNPNTGKFTLDFTTESKKKAQITVVDANGKEIYKRLVKGDKQYSLPIDISKESKGLCIIKIQQGDDIRARKILVE